MRSGLLVIVPTIVVGVVAAVVTIAAHRSDPAFVFGQQHPARIEPGQVEQIVTGAREPIPSGQGSAAVSAHCFPGPSGPKRNPWHCTVRYRSGDWITYRVVIQMSGRLHGVDSTGARVIYGCCVQGGITASTRGLQRSVSRPVLSIVAA